MRKIKVVFFDLWGTLVKTQGKSPNKQIASLFGLNKKEEKSVSRFSNTKKFGNFNKFLRELEKLINKQVTPEIKESIENVIKQDEKFMGVYDDSYNTLKRLKELGYQIGVISNTWQFSINAVMNKTIIPDYIDDFIFSFDAGYIKPSFKIYDIAMKKFCIRPVDAVMVGDSYEEDIKGAQEAGLKAYWIRREDSLKEEDNKFLSKNRAPIINSLSELSSIFAG